MSMQLPSGKIVPIEGVPEGTTKEQIKQKLISNGLATEEDFVAPAAADPLAATRAAMQESIPNPVTAPPVVNEYTMPQANIKAATKEAEDLKKKIEDAMASDKKTALTKLAMEAPPIVSAMVSAGSEVNALGAGIADLMDKYLPAPVSNLLSAGDMTPEQRMANRKKDMADANERQEMMDIAHPIASKLGKGVPYVATDFLLSPAARVANKAIKFPMNQAMKGLSKAGDFAEARIKPTNILSPAVREINTYAKGQLNQPTLSVLRDQAAEDFLIGAPLKGAIEGAANYNDTASQGALASTIGHGMSFAGARQLGATENVLSKSERDAVERARRFGYRATPGMITGNSKLQTMEQGMRSEPVFRDFFKERDIANQTAVANAAADSMGLERKASAADFNRQELQDHLNNLSAGYKDLENRTTSIYGINEVQEVGSILKRMQPTAHKKTSDLDSHRYKVLKSVAEEIRSKMLPLPTGTKFQSYQFKGADYQDLRSIIQDEITQAYGNSDRTLARELKKMQTVLDKTLVKGMDRASVREWKDMNEKYAMTNMVINKGMDPLGGIDAGKLTNHLMSDDEAKRTLMGQGGRVKNLQDIVTTRQLEKRQFGEVNWSGSGIESQAPDKPRTLAGRILTLPGYLTPKAADRFMFDTYMRGWPARTGVTGLTPRMISRITRSTEQGGGFYSDKLNTLLNTASGEEDKMADMGNTFDRLMKAMKKQLE